jgi:hypothetical protein
MSERSQAVRSGINKIWGYEETTTGQDLRPDRLEETTQLARAMEVRASPFLIGQGSRELPEGREESVRIRIGDYAYEVTKVVRPGTEAGAHWDYRIYRATPNGVLLVHGEDSPNLEHAERNARQVIALYIELDKVRFNEPEKYKKARG